MSVDTEFLETLLYSDDRPTVVQDTFNKKTPEYWYWRVLSYQNRWESSVDKEANKVLGGVLDQAEKLPFNKADDGVQNLLLRQALINFKKVTPAVKRATIIKLRKLLAPKLNTAGPDGKEEIAAPETKGTAFPSTLVVATPRLLKQHWESNQRSKRDLEDESCTIERIYTPASQDYLANQNLSNEQIDSFLRLVEDEAPEVPYLLTFVRKDLRLNKNDFGTKKMHYKLTLGQMELLGKKTAELQNNLAFWCTYASKLQPTNDKDLVNDVEARTKFLDKLKKFVLERCPKLNELVALVLYNWLTHYETLGKYDKGALKTYLAIPKKQSYTEGVAYKNKGNVVANDFCIPKTELTAGMPCLKPIGNDEPFVRRALRSVFQKGDEPYNKWAPELVNLEFARRLYTEVRLLSGAGNASDLKRTLVKYVGKYAYQELNERVDIEMAPHNKRYYSIQDAVSFDVFLKNVPELTVSVYEINARAYYEKYGKEIGVDIDVAGLTPNSVKTHTFSDPSIMKRSRTIDVPSLREKMGVFLVELVGNGQVARMLVRKGELRFISRQEFKDKNKDGGLGYVFKLLNDRNLEVKSARVIVGGKEYMSDPKTGDVYVPFASEDDDAAPVILEDYKRPGSATLQFMKFQTENWSMKSGMYVDRESLLEKQRAKIIVRPALFLNEQPVSVDNLQGAKLKIELVSMVNGEELTDTRVVRCDLSDNREFVFDVTVPTELRKVKLSLEGTVAALSRGLALETLKNEQEFSINAIDSSDALGDLHLIPRGASGYVLACYGKNGEAIQNQVVAMKLTHRYFKNALSYTLETNEDGLIFLGRLPDVVSLEVTAEGGTRVYPETHTWSLLEDQVNVPPVVNVMEKETVRIPFMTGDTKGPKVDVYDVNFVTRFKNVVYKDGYIEIKGLPTGDFVAMVRDQQRADVSISVASGNRFDQCAIGGSRIVEMSEAMPLQITMVKGNREKGYQVQLQGVNKTTRVHVFSSYLVPRFTAFSFMASPMCDPQVCDFFPSSALYGQQNDTSAEFRYIMARRAASKLPGNMLPRAGLISTPWSTEAMKQAPPPPQPKEAVKASVDARMKPRAERKAQAVLGSEFQRNTDPSNLEFLLEPSRVFTNLTQNSSGWVPIPTEATSSSHNLVQIVAVDDNNISMRNVILPTSTNQRTRDIRLMNGFPTEKHYSEVREVLIKQNGETVEVENWANSQIETVDDIQDVFELFLTVADKKSLQARETLTQFSFLTEWGEMNAAAKKAAYAKYACNEVNFYMYRKDKTFFDKVVKPSIASKFNKDFMDFYLLGNTAAVASYASFGKFRTLNVFERILLASMEKSLTESTMRSVKDQVACIPSNLAAMDRLFRLTLESKQLARANIEGLMDSGRFKTAVVDADDLTRCLQETRYYQVAFEDMNEKLISCGQFWLDAAEYFINGGGTGQFLSKYYGECTGNLTEMLLCLAMLDLAYRPEAEAKSPEIIYAGGAPNFTPGTTVTVKLNTPTIVLSRQLKDREFKTAALAVSTNYFDPEDTGRVVDGEAEDKFVQNQFDTQKIYGARVVITNVSSQKYDVEVLAQIPTGSIPVKGGFRTKNQIVSLMPYMTTQMEYYFYFPMAGEYLHFPAHVNKNGVVLGYGRESTKVVVIDPNTVEDTSSWTYFCNKAPSSDVLAHLKTAEDLHVKDLSKMSWRMQDEKFYKDVVRVLKERHMYCEQLWAWSLKHYDIPEIETYLNMSKDFKAMVSPQFMNSTLGVYDAFADLDFQNLEFWSCEDKNNGLNRTRTSKAGVMNDAFNQQYTKFLKRALFRSHSKSNMPVEDRMVGCYYYLVQGRVKEAMDIFNTVAAADGRAVSEFNYDYMKAYLAFFASMSGNMDALSDANSLADAYLKKPLTPSQRALWQGVKNQINELRDLNAEGGTFVFESAEEIASRAEVKLAFDVSSEGAKINYKNVSSVTVRFYLLDLELQFSTAPFRQKDNAYNFVQPTETCVVTPETAEGELVVPLPENCSNKNTIVEVSGAGMVMSKTLYDNKLNVQRSSASSGQIRVLSGNEPVSRAYIKVYAATAAVPDGQFFKDGFTDMRGRFDYRTVSSNAVSDVKRFAILIQTEAQGADVIEIDV